MRIENKFSGWKMTFGCDKDKNGFFVPIEKEKEVIREMLLMKKKVRVIEISHLKFLNQLVKSFLYLGHIR